MFAFLKSIYCADGFHATSWSITTLKSQSVHRSALQADCFEVVRLMPLGEDSPPNKTLRHFSPFCGVGEGDIEVDLVIFAEVERICAEELSRLAKNVSMSAWLGWVGGDGLRRGGFEERFATFEEDCFE